LSLRGTQTIHQSASRADVADFLVKQIDNDAFLRKTPVLTS
jgi:hypothetical protein